MYGDFALIAGRDMSTSRPDLWTAESATLQILDWIEEMQGNGYDSIGTGGYMLMRDGDGFQLLRHVVDVFDDGGEIFVWSPGRTQASG
jgi:hypothetical protein